MSSSRPIQRRPDDVKATKYMTSEETQAAAKKLAKEMWSNKDASASLDGNSKSEKEAILKDEDSRDDVFRNYQPPGRLIILEFITLIILVMLLLASPTGMTAVAKSGASGGVGLLRSCSGGTCTSWLGAGSSGSRGGGSTSAVSARDLETRQTGGSGSSAGSSSSASETTSPASFHLTAGLAAIVTFYTVLYAFLFHLSRWWYYNPPPLHAPIDDEDDPEKQLERKQRRSWWARRKQPATWYGVKRFGYRVSRAYTLVTIPMLVYIAFSSVMIAKDAGVGVGFYLLLWLCINSVFVALCEFLNPQGKVGSKLLAWRAVGMRPGGRALQRAQRNSERGKGVGTHLTRGTLRGTPSEQSRRRPSSPASPRAPPPTYKRGQGSHFGRGTLRG